MKLVFGIIATTVGTLVAAAVAQSLVHAYVQGIVVSTLQSLMHI